MKIYYDYNRNQTSFQKDESSYLLLPSSKNKITKYTSDYSYRILGGGEKLNQNFKSESKAKEIINKTKRMDRKRLSVNILQLLLKQIFKLKSGYEQRFNSESVLPIKDKINETKVDIVLKCFRDFYLMLMQITRNNSDMQHNTLMDPFHDYRHQLSVNKGKECQNTILELLKAKDVELKSRKCIGMDENVEEIVFIYHRKVSDKVLCPKENSYNDYNTLSFSLLEVLNKENYEDFLSVTRHIVCSCNIVIHQEWFMQKASQGNILFLTPELWKIEDNYQSIFDHCPLDSNGLKSDKSDNKNTKSLSLTANSNTIIENISKGYYGCQEDIYKIYSCLKSIENLTKNIPRFVLKKALEMKKL